MHHITRDTLEKFLSKSRLAKFSSMSGSSSFQDCLEIYLLNMQCSAKLYTALSQFEIILRNAINVQLIESYGSTWFLNKNLFFTEHNTASLLKSQIQLKEKNKEINSCNITASLTFGFWVNLFNSDYDKILWRNILSNIFSAQHKKPSRGLIRERLKNFNRLRNRISHCEPVLGQKLTTYYLQLIETISWINPEIAKWLDEEIDFSRLIPPLENFIRSNACSK